MADHKGEDSQKVAATVSTVPKATAIVALVLCFSAGYVFADWWSESRKKNPHVAVSFPGRRHLMHINIDCAPAIYCEAQTEVWR